MSLSPAILATINRINTSLYKKVKADHPCMEFIDSGIDEEYFTYKYVLRSRSIPGSETACLRQVAIRQEDIESLDGEQALAKMLYRNVIRAADEMQIDWDREASKGRSSPSPWQPPAIPPPNVAPAPEPVVAAPEPPLKPLTDVQSFLQFIGSKK